MPFRSLALAATPAASMATYDVGFKMSAIFTQADFLDVFARYNTAVGIAPLVLIALALLGVGAIAWDWRQRDAWASGILAALWIWAGLAYHLAFFADINPAAIFFGAVFVGQGLAFAHLGVWRQQLIFARPRRNARGGAGWLVLIYAILIYPLVSLASGHAWPAMPTFGAPCPVTLYTCGLLLWSEGPVPRIFLLVLLGWALLAMVVALDFGMHEDWGLLIAAAVTVAWLWRRGAAVIPARRACRRAPAITQRVWRHGLEK